MTTSSGITASILCASLIDGPEHVLQPVHRSEIAWQLADDSRRVVLCITRPSAIRLPHAVVAASLPSGSSPVSVGGGVVAWDGSRVRISRWWQPARPHFPALRTRLDGTAVDAFATSWADEIGRGEGLTPYADDVLCGALVLLRAAAHPVADDIADEFQGIDLERRTTATSAALLRLAASGYCIDKLANFLSHLATGLDQTERVEKDLLDVGHSSGHGLLAGVNQLMHGLPEGVAA